MSGHKSEEFWAKATEKIAERDRIGSAGREASLRLQAIIASNYVKAEGRMAHLYQEVFKLDPPQTARTSFPE
jgi:hypothetical protein